MELRRQQVIRYITPLREGGSLPALTEADDGFKYVLKFRGAGHGSKALIAELIGGEVARALGFRVPELVFLELDEDFGRTEPDEEIQDLLKASRGLNLGMHFLSGAVTVDPYVNEINGKLASAIVWLDAFLTNVDRTVQNTNMLVWNNEVWLIDHGASLYFHHAGYDAEKAAMSPFPYIKSHALLHKADSIEEIDKIMRQKITPRTLKKIVSLIPDDWLIGDGEDKMAADEHKKAYETFLTLRLANSSVFVKRAVDERNALI